ncbi:hypothetical protein SRABI80_03553 [Peribacillus frigoritolerans]|nr:hypothetical protein SRABI80_03553 [Peribacillus frigoritolerans]
MTVFNKVHFPLIFLTHFLSLKRRCRSAPDNEVKNLTAISIKRKNQRSTNRMKIVENRPYSFYGWVSKAMNYGANRAHSLV